MIDLLPCKFCGGRATYSVGPTRTDVTNDHIISCLNCGAYVYDNISGYQPDAAELEQRLIDDWNNGKAMKAKR